MGLLLLLPPAVQLLLAPPSLPLLLPHPRDDVLPNLQLEHLNLGFCLIEYAPGHDSDDDPLLLWIMGHLLCVVTFMSGFIEKAEN